MNLSYKKPVDQQLVDKLINYIQSNSKKSTKVIIDINGTINSAVAGVLFKKALAEKLIAIIFDFNTPKTGQLIQLCKSLELDTYLLSRGEAYQNELAAYRLHAEKDICNFYSRFINYHLLTTAEHMKAEVADTEDKSERLTTARPRAFYGSIMPFYSLYKTELYDLAKLLNISTENLNVDYWQKIDPVLFLLTDSQLSPEEISGQYNLDLEWLKKLKSHIEKQSFKIAVNQFII